jgi:phosphohistidine phosphatase
VDLLVIRHAVAEDRKAWARAGRDERLRPITTAGAVQMRAAARGIVRITPRIDRIVSSPLTRALETAEIVAAALGRKRVRQAEELEPERDPEALLRWLRAEGGSGTVGVVGHEPHLGTLVTWCLSKKAAMARSAVVVLEKGGACLVSFDKRPRAGKGTLQWLMTPSQLAAIRA